MALLWLASAAGSALNEMVSNRSAKSGSPVSRTAVSRLSMASTIAHSSTPWVVELPERNSVPLLMPQDKPCSRIRLSHPSASAFRSSGFSDN